jgi:hypothetical protein
MLHGFPPTRSIRVLRALRELDVEFAFINARSHRSVDDIEDVLARLKAHGAALVGELDLRGHVSAL